MPLYEYEKGVNDLQNSYQQNTATNDYARFIAKQQYAQQRQSQDQTFQRGFPQFTGQYAKRLGSGVQSGVFRDKLNQNVGDYNQQSDRLNQAEAGFDSNWFQNQAMQQSSYQQALLALQEQLKAAQAMQNPYATYEAVYQ